MPFIRYKAFTILVPQITCSLLDLIYNVLVYVVITKTNQVVDYITFDLIMWFLIVLFLMEVVMFFWIAYNIQFNDSITIHDYFFDNALFST